VKSSCISTDSIAADVVLPLLRSHLDPAAEWAAGTPYEYVPSCPSTNTLLREIADHGTTGAALATDDQTGGRGRLGRQWLSEPGRDLAFSVLLRPRLDPARGHLLALATGVAVAEVLEEELGLSGQVSLKWPNDVLLGGKKVCGILMEASAGAEGLLWAVAGIGINVNGEPGRMVASLPPERAAEWQGRPQPVSLKEYVGRAVPRAPLLAALLARLTVWWSALDAAESVPGLLEGWRTRDALAGRAVEVFAGADRSELMVAGEAAGIGEEGQLLIRAAAGGACSDVGGAAGLVEVFAGDVSVAFP
jgi:BirA family transcriptional regulator, biotin operon repressor / biotin---[acetyl-CoA-carboxylase] ligase